jgi:hypothetical protein
LPPHRPATPVPLRETVCGLSLALSTTESVPFKLPVLLGVKVTSMVQLAPDTRVGSQVVVSPKLVLAAMLEMLSVVAP